MFIPPFILFSFSLSLYIPYRETFKSFSTFKHKAEFLTQFSWWHPWSTCQLTERIWESCEIPSSASTSRSQLVITHWLFYLLRFLTTCYISSWCIVVDVGLITCSLELCNAIWLISLPPSPSFTLSLDAAIYGVTQSRTRLKWLSSSSSSSSQRGWFLSPKRYLTMSKDIFGCHNDQVGTRELVVGVEWRRSKRGCYRHLLVREQRCY